MKLVPSSNSRYVNVSTRGRITIPSDMRKAIGITKGDKIIFIRKGETIVLVKSKRIIKPQK
ncbi:MAG: AbrB/MazE/SpoVT family DNA-binding domain-containing protein [Nitrososphaera sp.]